MRQTGLQQQTIYLAANRHTALAYDAGGVEGHAHPVDPVAGQRALQRITVGGKKIRMAADRLTDPFLLKLRDENDCVH